MRFLRFSAALLLLALCAVAPAQEGAPKSGLAKGTNLPGPFHPYNVTGPRKGKFHCLVCENGLNPTVAIFSPVIDPPPAPFLKLLQGIDSLIAKYPKARMGAFVVYLTAAVETNEKRDVLEMKLADLAQPAMLRKVVISADKVEGPKGYNVSAGFVTVLLINHQEVVENLAFESELTDADVDNILKAVEAMVAPKKK